MANSRRRVAIIVAVVVIIIVLLLLLRCSPRKPVAPPEAAAPTSAVAAEPKPAAQDPAQGGSLPDEILTPATVTAPREIGAGAAFETGWTGPANEGDYLTIVPVGAADDKYGSYTLTRQGSPLRLTAPIDAGECEVRYVTGRSHTVLGRTAVTVVAAEATLDAADSATLNTPLSISWTGPDNKGDYITIVAAGTPDGKYAQYTTTDRGSPLNVTTPTDPGAAEIRYMTGQGARVLARRPLRVIEPDVSLDAPSQAIAGASVEIKWTGPAQQGDYITVVPIGTRDGEYRNYVTVGSSSTVKLAMPIDPGACELRYMTGRGARVLARRPITVVAAVVTLEAPAEAAAGSAVSITWKGPAHQGDYITIVAKGAAEGSYASYTDASRGSPLTVKALPNAGDAEIRYVSGQGARTLARRAIRITQ